MKPTVLYADDQEGLLAVYKHLLEARGYSVLTALNGHRAIELFRSRQPDIVLLDYNMQGFNGDEVAIRLRKIDADTPLVIFSGEEIPYKAQKLVDASIRKEAGVEALVATVTGLLAERSRKKAS